MMDQLKIDPNVRPFTPPKPRYVVKMPPFDPSITEGPEWRDCEFAQGDDRWRRGQQVIATRGDEQYDIVVMEDTTPGEATKGRCRPYTGDV